MPERAPAVHPAIACAFSLSGTLGASRAPTPGAQGRVAFVADDFAAALNLPRVSGTTDRTGVKVGTSAPRLITGWVPAPPKFSPAAQAWDGFTRVLECVLPAA